MVQWASGANPRAIVRVVEAPLNPLMFGGVGDGETLDDAAFVQMIAHAATLDNPHFYLPSGYTWKLSQPITPPVWSRWEGPGNGHYSIVNASSDVFSADTSIGHLEVAHLGIRSSPGGGHIFNFAGLSQAHMHDLRLRQDNANQTIIDCPYVVDCVLEKWWCLADSRTVPMIRFDAPPNAGSINDNTLQHMRLTDTGTPTTWAILLEGNSAGAIGNTVEHINFQGTTAGGLRARSHRHLDVRQIQFWDMAAEGNTISQDLVSLGQVPGKHPSARVEIAHVQRLSGTLDDGVVDIKVEGSAEVTSGWVRDCSGVTADFVVDLNGAPVDVERVDGTVQL